MQLAESTSCVLLVHYAEVLNAVVQFANCSFWSCPVAFCGPWSGFPSYLNSFDDNASLLPKKQNPLFLCKRFLPPPNLCKTAAQTGNRFKRRERRPTLSSLQCEDVRQRHLRSIAPYSLHIVIHVLQSITDLSCSFAKTFKASSASAIQSERN